MTKVSTIGRDHKNLVAGLLVLQMTAWVLSGISSFYLVLGTFLALPDGCEVPGLARLSRALRPLSHPYVINTLTICAPIVYVASNIPNIVLAPKYFELSNSISGVANDMMRGLVMQDPAALIPDDVKLLLIESHDYMLGAQKHVGIAFVFTTLFSLLVILIGYPSVYTLLFLLRKQLRDEEKRIRPAARDNRPEALEKPVGTAPYISPLDIHIKTSTDVNIDGPDGADMQPNDRSINHPPGGQYTLTFAPASAPSPRKTPTDIEVALCPASPSKSEEPLTPTTPRSLALTLQSPAHEKEAVVGGAMHGVPTLASVGQSTPAVGESKPTFLGHMRRRMSWSTRTQSTTESQQRDKTAALIRFRYMRRCFFTLATFYTFVCLVLAVYLGLGLFIALVHLLPNNPLVDKVSNHMLIFECVAAAILVMNFTLIGVKVFDSGTI